MFNKFLYGIGDALDRAGVTLSVLSVIGGFFTEDIKFWAAMAGVFYGMFLFGVGVYTKIELAQRGGKP